MTTTADVRAGAALPRAAAAQSVVAFVVVASLGFAQGGLEPRTWRLASLSFLALAAAALLSRTPILLGRLEWWMLAAFAALVGWTALSTVWSSQPTASLLQAERVLVYAAGILAFVLLVERAALPFVLGGTLAAIAVVAAYGLARKLFAPPPYDTYEGTLLYQPIGYANGLGIFAAIGILLALGLALRLSGAARPAALLPILVLGPALYLTSSRGAGLALAGGLAVLVLVAGGARRPKLAAVGAVAALGVLAAVLVASRGPARSLVGNNRQHYWHAALADYREHPVLGAGAGTFGPYWLRHRPDTQFTRTAHSLYLGTLADLGPLGLALVLAGLAPPLVALRRFRGPLAAGAAAGYAAYLLHTGIDWDWELPATTVPALLCGAVLLVGARAPSAAPLQSRVRTALLVAVFLVAAAEVARLASGPATPFGS
jgi:O-antigen ligase